MKIYMGMSPEEIQAQRLGKPAKTTPAPTVPETAPTDTAEKAAE